MKRMLINATHSEEVRVAIAAGQKLYNLDIDIPGQDRKKGNIYKGKITRVEPSLEAAFVDYGADRHGFLPYKEISRNYYTPEANKAKERPPIAQAVKEGTEVIIQVNKEERGNKGAAISTYISLAGRYLVYMPENPKAGGISRRIEGKTRQDLKAVLNQVEMPKNAGVIVRTAGVGRSVEEIEWDLNYLDQVWTAIKTMAASRPAPFFIYQESHLFIRALRDYLRPDIGEILIDNKKMYEQAREFMQQVMPHNLKKLSYYNDTTPLFSRYQIESQIQSAFSREVHLPSGGSLVIDHTEAMISIDINSARATKGSDIEETALNTNLEAADEIARQLRIRDLGGLVVIDFIDMRNHKNQRKVEQQLNEAVENDRARIQTSKISKFGLLEMSRQRLRSSINESSQFACPRCSGHGFIRNIESLSVSILRIMEEEALKPDTGKVIAQVPTKVANFIMNEKRDELNGLENNHKVPMVIVANEYYQSPQFDVKRLKNQEAGRFNLAKVELNKPEDEEQADNFTSKTPKKAHQEAAVNVITPVEQAPSRDEKSVGFFAWLKSLFASNNSNEKSVSKQNKSSSNKKHPRNNRNKPYKQNKKPHSNKQNQQHKKQTQHKQQPKKTPKKPVHNHQKNQQANSQNKQQSNKTVKKPHSNQGQQKPHNPKAQQKQQAPKKQVAQQKPQANAQKQKTQQKPVDNKPKPTVDKETVAMPNTNEEMLKRPLGSVASYAAKKAQQNTAPNQDKKPVIEKKAEQEPKVVEAKAVNKVDATVTEPKPKVQEKKPAETASKQSNNKSSVKESAQKPQAKEPKPKTSEAKKVETKQPAKKAEPKVAAVEPKEQSEPKSKPVKKAVKKVAKKVTPPKPVNQSDGIDFDVSDSVVAAAKKSTPKAKPTKKVEKKKEDPKQTQLDFDI